MESGHTFLRFFNTSLTPCCFYLSTRYFYTLTFKHFKIKLFNQLNTLTLDCSNTSTLQHLTILTIQGGGIGEQVAVIQVNRDESFQASGYLTQLPNGAIWSSELSSRVAPIPRACITFLPEYFEKGEILILVCIGLFLLNMSLHTSYIFLIYQNNEAGTSPRTRQGMKHHATILHQCQKTVFYFFKSVLLLFLKILSQNLQGIWLSCLVSNWSSFV